ncbi:MAG: acetyl/propionyl-CoA carboxylase subunit alpha, partial [Euzebyales bacterium]|nr:acetyl/propionyl-CoA carboxylase subunit alpha [Euzebyales bacterium]
SARREAANAFGDDDLLLERFIERPRHIEIQVLADGHGNAVHLGERECSLQRRHQKVIEECPSPLLDGEMRERMGGAAIEVARACGYSNAGTVEFIVSDERGKGAAAGSGIAFFFLEMNTRLQVEHPVTEQVYGIDLVEWQLRVAAREPLGFEQDDLTPEGHAIEARVYAEDPARGFLPTGGTVLHLRDPAQYDGGVRIDSGIDVGTPVGSAYDPLLAKVIAHGRDRGEALRKLDGALAGYELLGVVTNIGFLRALLADADVRSGRLDTQLIDRKLEVLVSGRVPDDGYVAAALGHLLALEPDQHVPSTGPVDPFDIPGGWRVGEHAWTLLRLQAGGGQPVDVRVRGRASRAQVQVGDGARVATSASTSGDGVVATIEGRTFRYAFAERGGVAWVGHDGHTWAFREEDELAAARHHDTAAVGGELFAPMPGTVSVVNVAKGDRVSAGQTLLVVEAMKMEHPITAPVDGVVATLHVGPGQAVAMEAPLVVVEAERT